MARVNKYKCTPVQAAKALYTAAAAKQMCPCCGASAQVPSSWCGCDMGAQGCTHEHMMGRCDNTHTSTALYGCGLWQHWLELCTVSTDVHDWLRGANS